MKITELLSLKVYPATLIANAAAVVVPCGGGKNIFPYFNHSAIYILLLVL